MMKMRWWRWYVPSPHHQLEQCPRHHHHILESVFLDSFNMAYREENNILDQKYASKYFGIFIIKILNFKSDCGKCIIKEIQHITIRNSSNWFSVLLYVIMHFCEMLWKIKFFIIALWTRMIFYIWSKIMS